MRISLLTFVLVCFTLPASAAGLSTASGLSPDRSGSSVDRLFDLLSPPGMVFDAACCKVCNKGQACGDSCISRSNICRVGPGCACQAPGT